MTASQKAFISQYIFSYTNTILYTVGQTVSRSTAPPPSTFTNIKLPQPHQFQFPLLPTLGISTWCMPCILASLLPSLAKLQEATRLVSDLMMGGDWSGRKCYCVICCASIPLFTAASRPEYLMTTTMGTSNTSISIKWSLPNSPNGLIFSYWVNTVSKCYY